jgi:hypothetical protein
VKFVIETNLPRRPHGWLVGHDNRVVAWAGRTYLRLAQHGCRLRVARWGERADCDGVVATLSNDPGVLRCTHGDRLLVEYTRGVSAVEVAPRGAVL